MQLTSGVSDRLARTTPLSILHLECVQRAKEVAIVVHCYIQIPSPGTKNEPCVGSMEKEDAFCSNFCSFS